MGIELNASLHVGNERQRWLNWKYLSAPKSIRDRYSMSRRHICIFIKVHLIVRHVGSLDSRKDILIFVYRASTEMVKRNYRPICCDSSVTICRQKRSGSFHVILCFVALGMMMIEEIIKICHKHRRSYDAIAHMAYKTTDFNNMQAVMNFKFTRDALCLHL